ncbi:MAG: VanW family protein [Patescibacteria group bacterium]
MKIKISLKSINKLKAGDKRALKLVILCLAAIFCLALVSFGIYSLSYSNKVYARQYIGETSFGGKSKAESRIMIEEKIADFSKRPIVLVNVEDGQKFEINPTEIGLNYNLDATLDLVWGQGRGHIWPAFLEQLQSIFKKTDHSAVFAPNNESAVAKIKSIAEQIDHPEKDFKLVYREGEFILDSDRSEGKRVDQTKIISLLKQSIEKFDNKEIEFKPEAYSPSISEEKAKIALANANKIVEVGDLVLKLDNQNHILDRDSIGGVIKSQGEEDDLKIVFDEMRMKKFVETLARGIDVEPNNAKLTVKDGKVVVFQISRAGKVLLQKQVIADIQTALLARISSEENLPVNLAVDTKKPEVSDSDIETYGIKELVGTATTDFKGSTTSRIHNLTIGTNAITGVILKPGETFSTLAHLGEIDASSGYLQELVIKNDQTVPDYGGGLCQVSSTLFRTALNAGMKITERQNHSYRVSYYEPPVGMDATIYDPSPDFKFVNNYATYILIQSKIEGTKLTFDFYGTKDGRQVSVSTPEVKDFVDPPAPVMVDSDTLPTGQKKQLQKAHQGATANFEYKAVALDGTILQQRVFTSKYNAIPEKWLVGTGSAPASTCSDGTQNGDETGIDCGGSCPNQCQ